MFPACTTKYLFYLKASSKSGNSKQKFATDFTEARFHSLILSDKNDLWFYGPQILTISCTYFSIAYVRIFESIQ